MRNEEEILSKMKELDLQVLENFELLTKFEENKHLFKSLKDVSEIADDLLSKIASLETLFWVIETKENYVEKD